MLSIQLYRLCVIWTDMPDWEQKSFAETMSKVTSILIFRLKRVKKQIYNSIFVLRKSEQLLKDNSINNIIRRFDSFCSTLT